MFSIWRPKTFIHDSGYDRRRLHLKFQSCVILLSAPLFHSSSRAHLPTSCRLRLRHRSRDNWQLHCLADSCVLWVDNVESERSHPSKLWEFVDKLLSRGRTSPYPSLSVETLNSFFVEKVCKMRASSASALTFSPVRDGVSLPQFSVDDVVSSVHKLPDKSSASDPYRHTSSSKSSTFSLHSLQSCSTDPWLLVTSHAPLRMHPVHWCWRSKGLTLPTPAHTVQFPIWRYCLSYWSD